MCILHDLNVLLIDFELKRKCWKFAGADTLRFCNILIPSDLTFESRIQQDQPKQWFFSHVWLFGGLVGLCTWIVMHNLVLSLGVVQRWMDRSHTWKVTIVCWALSGILWNHTMTLGVLFPRFTFVALMTSLLMLSKMCLLIMPISDFEGLISLQDGLLVKSGLWSFNVINASLLA